MKLYSVALLLLFTVAANAQNFSFSRNASHINSVPNGTVSSLGTCLAGKSGNIANVSDALSPTVGATVSGGGAVVTLVHCNGSNWIVG